jgi:hypothetical protein
MIELTKLQIGLLYLSRVVTIGEATILCVYAYIQIFVLGWVSLYIFVSHFIYQLIITIYLLCYTHLGYYNKIIIFLICILVLLYDAMLGGVCSSLYLILNHC